MKTIAGIWSSMRPGQWNKNALVLAPVIFAQKAADPALLINAVAAAFLFSIVSGCNYIFNDILDREKDRYHPRKNQRPIAGGSLAPATALASALVMTCLALAASFMINQSFGWISLAYLGLGMLYSNILKNVVILDVMTISAGFVLRVVGGGAAIGVHVSKWLFLCTILLALFLSFSKRRHELLLLDNNASEHRNILREYSPYFLDQMISVVTASTVIAYSLYAISPEVAEKLGTSYLYLTIPFVLYGIFRYLYLIHQKAEGGDPSSLIIHDRPLLVNIVLWVITIIAILYVAI